MERGEMSMEGKKRIFPMNTIRICVEQYREFDMAGEMYCQLSGEALYFQNLSQFLLQTDRMLDHNGGPQSWQEKRSFQEKSRQMYFFKEPKNSGDFSLWKIDEGIETRWGTYGTYDIVIQSRRHTSWQGFVRDENGQFLGSFESELMLLRLILTHMEHRKAALFGRQAAVR